MLVSGSVAMLIITRIVILSTTLYAILADRGAPPGVNPQHYETQYHPQAQQPHMHTPQQYAPYSPGQGKHPEVPQYGQVPHQHGQVPQQHGQMPQQHGQIPQQQGQAPTFQQQQQYQNPNLQAPGTGGHVHVPHPDGQQPILNAANMQHEKGHIGEHLNVPTLDTSKMSEPELQFHYFKMHDTNNDNMLDACELTKSLIHWHEQGREQPNVENVPQPKIFTDEELEQLIDPILQIDDTDNDGYISYTEFIKAQQKEKKG